jgi:4-hydroxy-3-polyprenylbenzoate decarboxylase
MTDSLRDNRQGATIAAPEASGAPRSLRDFIGKLGDTGRLTRVREATHWRFDLGKRTRESKTPLLFENIEDYPGRRVFTNGLRSFELIGLALGAEEGISRQDLLAEITERVAHPLRPKVVESGPVVENIVPAGDIDLSTLPVPHWHPNDAGRYPGTWHINVTKDPETNVRNVGVYRMQLLDARRATVSTAPESHLALHVAKAERDGQALPMAVAIGAGEAVVMAAAAAYPCGGDEYELAGGLQQKPVEIMCCRTVDLEVPANSEIVIEGWIQPGLRVQDGPYFDYAGTVNTNPRAFVFEATRLMFRNDFIFRGTSVGVPGAEDHQLFAILAELNLLDFHRSSIKKHVQDMMLKQRLLRWTKSDS